MLSGVQPICTNNPKSLSVVAVGDDPALLCLVAKRASNAGHCVATAGGRQEAFD